MINHEAHEDSLTLKIIKSNKNFVLFVNFVVNTLF